MDGTGKSETRIETVARLRRWGMWNEAQIIMAGRREVLRAQGHTRKEAREEAWRFIQRAFSEEELASVGFLDWDDDLMGGAGNSVSV